MKTIKSYPLLLTALVLTLCLSACGSKGGGQEVYRAPDIIEDAVYDPDAQGDYSDYFGKWVGIRDCEYTTMLVTPADGGMRFELYKDDRLAASGSAQQVPATPSSISLTTLTAAPICLPPITGIWSFTASAILN